MSEKEPTYEIEEIDIHSGDVLDKIVCHDPHNLLLILKSLLETKLTGEVTIKWKSGVLEK